MQLRKPLSILLAAATIAACGGSALTTVESSNPPGPPPGPPPPCGDFAPCNYDSGSDGRIPSRVPKEHRAVANACDAVRNVPEPTNVPDSGFNACTKHADCTAGRNGRCEWQRAGLQCSYDQCYRDSECGTFVCSCRAPNGRSNNICLAQGNCKVDADCGAVGYCSPSLGSCGHYSGTAAYFCHTPSDECIDDSDCTTKDAGGFGTPYCAYEPTVGRWKCSTAECAG